MLERTSKIGPTIGHPSTCLINLPSGQQMVASVFVVDQAAQAYDIYLIIYVCVGITEADARGHT